MPETNSTEYQKVVNNVISDGNERNCNVARYKATIPLNSQASGGVVNLFKVPAGQSFCFGNINSSVSLGTSTIKIGTADDDDKYRASAVHTAAGVPTAFGAATGFVPGGNASAEIVKLTVGTAALPASGTLIVDMYFSRT